jgi:hypothetical protein
MANPRPTRKDLADAKNAVRREEMELAIAEGRLVVRKMTPEELEQSEARWVAGKERAATRKRRGYR